MEKIYLLGIKFQRALEFSKIREDLKNDTDFTLVGGNPIRIEFIEIKYEENREVETGKTHIGYLGDSVFFEYKENVYFIRANILDENTLEWEITGYKG